MNKKRLRAGPSVPFARPAAAVLWGGVVLASMLLSGLLFEVPARADSAGTFDSELVSMTDGRQIYEHICRGCHMANAGGAVGAGRFPALTKNLALELAPIRVNLIAAGFVDTPLSASLLGDQLDARREQLRTTLPIKRVVGPADIAALAVHLMTNTAVTGATFDIDGGQQLVEG